MEREYKGWDGGRMGVLTKDILSGRASCHAE